MNGDEPELSDPAEIEDAQPLCAGTARPKLTNPFPVNRCLNVAEPKPQWEMGQTYACPHCGRVWTALMNAGGRKVWEMKEER